MAIKLPDPAKRRSKPHRPFRPVSKEKRTYKRVVYDSKLEATRAAELDLLVRAGEVAWVLRQVPVQLGDPEVDRPFKVDFVVARVTSTWAGGANAFLIEGEEHCAVVTREKARRIKQWRQEGPFTLRVITKGGEVEVVEGGG